jgi:signal transduction histidine kinase
MAKFLDARDTLTRSALLDLSGLAYLLVVNHTDHPPTALQWALAVPAFASALLLHRRQPINLLVQTLLFGVAIVLLDDSTINQVGTAWAIGELALWAPRRRYVAGGVALVAAVYLLAGLPSEPQPILQALVGLAMNLGLPVLLGLVVRTTQELGTQAAQRAAEEQRRRESEHRADRADERSAIARELHDVVAHHVASMVLRIGVARHVLPDVDPRTAEVFDDVHRTGTAALADLRRLVAVLRDPESGRGDASLTAIEPSALPVALAGAVETARLAGVVVEAEIDPAVVELDAVRGLALLRLTQEALTNVAKHAGPEARASLRVEMDRADLHWAVADDGGRRAARVPSPSGPVPGGGHGLIGMRERVEVLGGSLTAGRSGTGWRVATVLPGALPAVLEETS